MSCVLSTYLYGAFHCMFLSCHVRTCGFTLKRVHGMTRTYSHFGLNFQFFSCTLRNKSPCSFIKYISIEKNVSLTVLNYTCCLFIIKRSISQTFSAFWFCFYFFCVILKLIFLDVHTQCFFCSFYNKCPRFIISFY